MGSTNPFSGETIGMPEVKVDLGTRSYPILIDRGLMARLGELLTQWSPETSRVLVITDTNVAPLYLSRVRSSLEQAGIATAVAKVSAGEASKSLAQAYSLYAACTRAGLERSSAVVALGGGVVGDLAGFVAATYLRGVRLIQVPTSLLAQVDSSVGGKTAVDLPEGKNLVGAFHQPTLVAADLEALSTLPRRELVAGMAEVVKHGLIRDADFFRFLESHVDEILALDYNTLGSVVEVNCRIKAAVVSADEREAGLRAILNMGHTVGHAVEAAMGYGTLLHGEAVSIGMVAALRIAQQVGVLQEPDLETRLLNLLTRLGLPVRLPQSLVPDALTPLMMRDKKVKNGRIRWVLPVRSGEVTISSAVPMEVVHRVLEEMRR